MVCITDTFERSSRLEVIWSNYLQAIVAFMRSEHQKVDRWYEPEIPGDPCQNDDGRAFTAFIVAVESSDAESSDIDESDEDNTSGQRWCSDSNDAPVINIYEIMIKDNLW